MQPYTVRLKGKIGDQRARSDTSDKEKEEVKGSHSMSTSDKYR